MLDRHDNHIASPPNSLKPDYYALYIILGLVMDNHNRLFRFPKPAWLNSANTRTAGVYFAGALVSTNLSNFFIHIADPRT